jgi:hypothetical protein
MGMRPIRSFYDGRIIGYLDTSKSKSNETTKDANRSMAHSADVDVSQGNQPV